MKNKDNLSAFEKAVSDTLKPQYNVIESENRKFSEPVPVNSTKEKHISPILIFLICLLLLISAFSVYCIISKLYGTENGYYSPETNTTIQLGLNGKPEGADEIIKDADGRYTMAGIAKIAGPSVVEITTYNDLSGSKAVGSGSGIILSEDGYIVTNAHVITSAKYLSVKLDDRTAYQAEEIGHDSKTDLAVIKIEPKAPLSPAVFGNSDEVVRGEPVAAIGNPGGLSGSISGGYVSGVNRKVKSEQTGREMDCIQTDAAISPGNSGGALVNMYGQVIGITSSKYISSSYEGIGFAISINAAKPIIEELLAKGFIDGRFKVGISFYGINEEAAKSKGIPAGLLIESVDENCDISKTGIKTGDVITETEGKKVTDYDGFMEAIGNKKAGDTVSARVARNEGNDKISYFDIEFKLMPDSSGDY